MNLFGNTRFLLVLKVTVFVLMCWAITSRLVLSGDFKQQVNYFIAQLPNANIFWLVAAIALMPVNWLIEVFKWRILLQNPQVHFSALAKGVIAGITVGFVTPGRTGEFIGRVMYMDEKHKTRVFYLSSLGGVAQTVVTLVAGSLIISWFTNNSFLNGITIGLAVAFLLFYFLFNRIALLLRTVPFLNRYGLVVDNTELPPINIQLAVLLIATLRFAVYSAQYVLLFNFFGLHLQAGVLFMHVIVFLLLQTFSPLMPLLDVSYRGGTALYVFKNVTNNNLAVLSVVTIVWLLNLVLPAVIGYFFILRKKKE